MDIWLENVFLAVFDRFATIVFWMLDLLGVE